MELPFSITMILGVCGIGFLAIGLPLGIYFSLRQKRGPSAGDVLQRAGQGARQPWSGEEASLAELSSEVARLKNQENDLQEQAGRGDDPAGSQHS